MAAFEPIFKINGLTITSPTDVSCGLADLSSSESGRSTRTGAMTKDVIAQKRTMSFTWVNLSFDDAHKIAGFCKSKGVFVYLTYPDLGENKNVTRRFYTGDLKYDYGVCGKNLFIKSIKCDFIEM